MDRCISSYSDAYCPGCVPIMTVYTIGGTDIFHERVINKNINLLVCSLMLMEPHNFLQL